MKNAFVKGLSLLFVIICAFGFSLTAYAMEPGDLADSTTVASKVQMLDFNGLKHGRYKSPKAQENGEERGALIVYFGNPSYPEEKGLLNQMVSDYSDLMFKDHCYYILAPSLPEGDKWVNTPGKFDADSPTQAMNQVLALVDQRANNFRVYNDRIVVMGVGDGATAAFDFACRLFSYTEGRLAVERVLTVGGTCDVDAVTKLAKGGKVSFQCFIPTGEAGAQSISRAAESVNADPNARSFSFTEVAGNTANALDYALSYGEPSVTEWATAEFFGSATYVVNIHTKGEGGKIAGPTSVVAGGSVTLNITVDKGYAISDVLINNELYGVSALTKVPNNPNMYTYTFSNVNSECGIEVTFVSDHHDALVSDKFIDDIIKWLSVVAVTVILVSVAVFVIDRTLRKNKAV